jgi:hypothetical protein
VCCSGALSRSPRPPDGKAAGTSTARDYVCRTCGPGSLLLRVMVRVLIIIIIVNHHNLRIGCGGTVVHAPPTLPRTTTSAVRFTHEMRWLKRWPICGYVRKRERNSGRNIHSQIQEALLRLCQHHEERGLGSRLLFDSPNSGPVWYASSVANDDYIFFNNNINTLHVISFEISVVQRPTTCRCCSRE